jgi:ABC-type xylose transport system, permease component
MATHLPDETLSEQAAGQSGLAGAWRSFASAGLQRLRQGELGSLPVIVGLIVIWGYFESQQSVFLSARNLSNLVLQIASTGAVAIGIVLVLLLGEIDLSVGSVAGLSSAILGVSIVNHGWPWWLAIIVILAVGAAIGAFQGMWFAIIGVPSFVVTLAGFLGWQGLQLRVLGSTGTVNVFEPHIQTIAQSYLPGYWGWIVGIGAAGGYALSTIVEHFRRRRAGLGATSIMVALFRIGVVAVIAVASVQILNSFNGVPTAGVILLGLVVFFSLVTTRTRFGRYVFAVGGNAEAARRAGININRIRITVFALAGVMAAIGGLIFVSRLTAASTQTGGGTFLLEAIAAAVIGGTSLFGGRGTVWSALLGALVIGSVSNGLDLLAQPPEIKYMVEGAILLAAVTVDAVSRRGRATAGRG